MGFGLFDSSIAKAKQEVVGQLEPHFLALERSSNETNKLLKDLLAQSKRLNDILEAAMTRKE